MYNVYMYMRIYTYTLGSSCYTDQPDAMSEDYRLILHEVIHLLNGIKVAPYYFINEEGMCPDRSDIYYDAEESWSGHTVRYVKTPEVLRVAREQFGCEGLEGMYVYVCTCMCMCMCMCM